jgi:hypothetical protein
MYIFLTMTRILQVYINLYTYIITNIQIPAKSHFT